MARITIDPITRIEGHLRIDCQVDGGKVTNAWSSGQMWRGIEKILEGRDPRDAWIFTQRICGVCTTVHAITSVRAVENALDMAIPVNAQYIRNMVIGAHGVHDHIVHFYHLGALDWVDIVSALDADPVAASNLAQSLSDWRYNSPQEMKAVQEKLKTFVASGQLGIFANGYWGHPAMKLPPEVNLIAAAHYLQALEYQRIANKIVTVLGGKTPHVQNLAVGGVTNSINLDSQSVLNMERLMYVKTLIDQLEDFVTQAYLVDIAAVGAFYLDWAGYGKGVTNYLAAADMPMDEKGTVFDMPGGYIPAGDINRFEQITSFQDAMFRDSVKESTKHSWYATGTDPLHPFQGETNPNYTDWQEDGKYSWVKSPTYKDEPAQVGPLANVLTMFAAGDASTKKHLGFVIENAGAIAKTEIPLAALHSTLGRHAARAVRCAVMLDSLKRQWTALVENVAKGDVETYRRPEFPKGEIQGFGFHEAPRGVLSHWAVIDNGKIKNYQCVVPSTWNAGPRNHKDQMGPYEAALVGNPVADEARPVEVLRTVHSFDPCLACAIHLVDTENNEIVKVKAL